MMTNDRSKDFAWAAGLFDGEGCTSVHRTRYTSTGGTKKEYVIPQMQVGMHDEHSVRRFAAAVGIGNVGGPYGPYSPNKTRPDWFWRVTKREDVLLVLNRLWDWLGVEKREQALGVLTLTSG